MAASGGGSGDTHSMGPSPLGRPVIVGLRPLAPIGFLVYVHPVSHLLVEADLESNSGLPPVTRPDPPSLIRLVPGLRCGVPRAGITRLDAGSGSPRCPHSSQTPAPRFRPPANPEPIVPRPGTVTWVPLRRSAAHREAEEPGSIRVHRISHLLG